jgi:hypothetical protein
MFREFPDVVSCPVNVQTKITWLPEQRRSAPSPERRRKSRRQCRDRSACHVAAGQVDDDRYFSILRAKATPRDHTDRRGIVDLACSSAHLQLNAFWLSASNAAFTYDPSALRRWSGLTETPPAKIHPTTALRDGSALTQRHRQPVSPPHHRYRSASMIPTQVIDRSRCHAGLRVQSP